MGIGDILGGIFGRKKESTVSVTSTTSLNVDLQKKINLHKDNLVVSLQKNGLDGIQARIGMAIDKSGSMYNMYAHGVVQDTVERLYAVAYEMDDNGTLDVWSFNNRSAEHPGVSIRNIEGYVRNNLDYGGGTSYAPTINDILNRYVHAEPSGLPSVVFFITDGDNDDHEDTEQLIKAASAYPIFWQFIGIGSASFNFLKRLDNMKGRIVDNANFFELNDLHKISDKQLYDRILGELPQWLRDAKRAGILN